MDGNKERQKEGKQARKKERKWNTVTPVGTKMETRKRNNGGVGEGGRRSESGIL